MPAAAAAAGAARLLPRLVCLLTLAAAAAANHLAISPDQVYVSDSPPTINSTVFVPATAVDGRPLAPPTPGVVSAEACADACRAALPTCSTFQYCDKPAGCFDDEGSGLAYRSCLLQAPACPSDGPGLSGNRSSVTSGFPLHHAPDLLSGTDAVLGQGVQGADINCSISSVPGMCATSNPYLALFLCSTMPECLTVTVLQNGLDGCSNDTLAVLKGEVLTPSNAFVSPEVATLSFQGTGADSQQQLFLPASAAAVELPSDAERAQQAAGGAGGDAYLGCSVARGALLAGDPLGTLDGVASAGDCCRACRARPRCTVFNYCEGPGGCSYQPDDAWHTGLSLAARQCQLVSQELVGPLVGAPVVVAARGPGVNFTAGAPLQLAGPELAGYTRALGVGVYAFGRYECNGTIRPETNECVLPGQTPQALAEQCTDDPRCRTMVLKLGTTSLVWPNATSDRYIAFLKNTTSESHRSVVPTSTLYLKDSPARGSSDGVVTSGSGTSSSSSSGSSSSSSSDGSSSSSSTDSGGGGLSAGAIAGIAVGAAAAAVVAATGGWMAWRRRRRPAAGSAATSGGQWAGKDLEEAGCSADGSPFGSLGVSGGPDSDGTGGELEPAPTAAALPELLTLVAEKDAAAHAVAVGLDAGASCPLAPQLLSAGSLPAELREWVIDSSQLSYVRTRAGTLWEVGSGASAKVYKVRYNGEVIAAKEIEVGASRSARETFITEARHLQALRHPNVVTFIGVAVQGEKGIVLMEYAEGRDLFAALDVRAAGSPDRVFGWHRRGRRVAWEIAKALNYLHTKGVVHLDLKSPNVLLTGAGTAKLADVGFARIQTHSHISNVAPVGTFAWIAPEVLLGQRCSSAVDIYSFGVVMWELITGERPARGKLRAPHVPRECPQEAADLMWDCLSEDPEQRPTAQELMQRLTGMQKQQARPPSRQDSGGSGAASGGLPSGGPHSGSGGGSARSRRGVPLPGRSRQVQQHSDSLQKRLTQCKSW